LKVTLRNHTSTPWRSSVDEERSGEGGGESKEIMRVRGMWKKKVFGRKKPNQRLESLR